MYLMRTNYPLFNRKLEQYLQMKNLFDSDNPLDLLYIEPIEQGFLMIYKNWETFLQHQMQILQRKADIPSIGSDKTLIKVFDEQEMRDAFPTDGLIIQLELITQPDWILFTIFNRLYVSMNPLFQINMKNDNQIEIVVPNLQVLQKYISVFIESPEIVLSDKSYVRKAAIF